MCWWKELCTQPLGTGFQLSVCLSQTDGKTLGSDTHSDLC